MSLASAALVAPTTRPMGRVHVLGAGPVGLFLAALLQSIDGQRGPPLRAARRVHADPDGVARRRTSSPTRSRATRPTRSTGRTSRRSSTRSSSRRAWPTGARVAPDLRALLEAWTLGFVPLNTIERTLSELIDARATGTVERVAGEVDAGRARSRCSSPATSSSTAPARAPSCATSLVPGGIDPAALAGTRQRFRLEYALVVTFLYDQHYACNEYCKYYKNVENADYKFIPAVHRTFYDGATSHVTGIVAHQQGRVRRDAADVRRRRGCASTSRASRSRWTGSSTRSRPRPTASWSGDLEITRIPLDVYHARNATSRRVAPARADHPLATTPVFLLGRRGDRVAVLPVDLAGPRVRLLPRRPHRQPGAADRRRSSTATRRSCTGSGCASTCGPR